MFGKKKKVIEDVQPNLELEESEIFKDQIAAILLKYSGVFNYNKLIGHIVEINNRKYILKTGYKPLFKFENEDKYYSCIRNHYAAKFYYDPLHPLIVDYCSYQSYPYYYDKMSTLVNEFENQLVDNKLCYIAKVIVAVALDKNGAEQLSSSTMYRAHRTDFMVFPPKCILSDMEIWGALSMHSSNKTIREITPNLLFRARKISLKKAIKEYELEKRKQELSLLDLGEKMTEYIAVSPNATTLALGLYRNTTKFGQYELDKIIEERRLDVYGRNDSK